MNDEHFNIRVFIDQVDRDPDRHPRNGSKPLRVVTPIEIKVTANSIEAAVRKVKAYLDIEVSEQ